MNKKAFDIIVIWAGSGWLTSAIGLSQAWKKVALIESWKIGGDCTNVWCIPSKALIDIASKNPEIWVVKALERVREMRQHFRNEETPEWLKNFWITFFAGKGSFIVKNTVEIHTVGTVDLLSLQESSEIEESGYPEGVSLQEKNNQQITAKQIIISTGSHPKIYDIPWLPASKVLTNESIFEVTEDIKDLLVIGGWYIWCELAESFANLWVQVTIVQRNDRLIPREEEETSELITESFLKKWIKIFTNSTITSVESENILCIQNNSTQKITKIPLWKVLVALWRESNNLWLKIENGLVQYNKKWIKTNKYNQTVSKNIYAIWDCVQWNPQFTHWANHEARGVIRNIIFPYIKKCVRNSPLPATLYTHIEVARVWKTYSELLEYYNSDDIVSKILYFDQNDRSIVTNDEGGFVKINFKRVSGKILGATIVWKGAWEMLPVLTLAMNDNISGYKLSSQIFAYPTKSELIKKVADQFTVWTLSNIRWELKYFFKDNLLQIVTALVWISFITIYLCLKSYYGLTNLELAKKMFQFVWQNAVWGPLIYILLYAIRPIVLFPATLMTLMSGALFWVFWGFIFTMIWENMSANFAYFLGRVFWKKMLKPDSTGIVADLRDKLSGDSFVPILMTRLLFFPFDMVNYSAGMLKARWRWFFLWTAIGIIPWALMVIIAWASIKNVSEFDPSTISFEPQMLVYSWIIFILSLGLAKYLKKKDF